MAGGSQNDTSRPADTTENLTPYQSAKSCEKRSNMQRVSGALHDKWGGQRDEDLGDLDD